MVFDGTSKLGEVLVIAIRHVHEREIYKRLLRVDFLAKTKTGEEVALLLLAAMREGTNVNNVAMGVVKIVYHQFLDVC